MVAEVPHRLIAAFRPRLWRSLGGYRRDDLARDIGAGLTVGVVALPLAMAFAIASGLPPAAGLYTAIVAGFLISALGGSRVQIGGPAGAFIVIVYGILERYGLANLVLATALSGVMLFFMGLFRLGTLIRFIPVAVVTGFTNGIAVLIMLSQIRDFLGLTMQHVPASFMSLVPALLAALPSFNPVACTLAAGTLAVVALWPRLAHRLVRPGLRWTTLLPGVPGSVLGLALATAAAWSLELPVETIGSRFGGIAASLPTFHWPEASWGSARFLLVPALTLALLGAIESLLCARVADGLCGDRHDPNQELMAQGIANVVSPLMGGMPATGTIARTVTNVKSGARSPVAGIVHAATLLLVLLVAAPLAQHVPLAALAGILMFVAWNMGEWQAFAHLGQYRPPYRVTLLAVFILTVVVDLTAAVEAGLVAACLTFIYRISSLTRAETVALTAPPQEVQAWRLYGALFFGAVRLVESMEDHLPARALLLDLKNLIYMDSSGADTLQDLQRSCQQRGVRLILCGVAHQPLDICRRTGLLDRQPPADVQADLAAGLAAIQAEMAAPVMAPDKLAQAQAEAAQSGEIAPREPASGQVG